MTEKDAVVSPERLTMRRHWPLAVTVFALAGVLAVQVATLTSRTYSLDDPYIHMAIAKNLANHGVWGISPHEFASASSSPLWIVLLAGIYACFGLTVLAPAILNVVFALATPVVAYVALRRSLTSNWMILLSLLGIVFVTALSPLATTGMEHTLHTFLSLAFITVVASTLTSESTSRRDTVLAAVLGALLPMARYEAYFLVGIAFLFWFGRGQRRLALTVGVASAIPAALFGLYSMAHGWLPVPLSIVIKSGWRDSDYGPVRYYATQVMTVLSERPYLMVLVVATLAPIALGIFSPGSPKGILSWIVAGTTIAHVELAKVGTFFRYDAYLIALNLLAIALWLGPILEESTVVKERRRAAAGLLIAALALSPLVMRSLQHTSRTRMASRNIFEQQVQMARFIEAYYPTATIAMNDIGAASYFSDAHILDLYGLASREVAQLKRARRLNRETIAALAQAQGTDIAILYNTWFKGKIPESWVEVGRWKIEDNLVCGSHTVSFYAVKTEAVGPLAERFQEFSEKRLPKGVNTMFMLQGGAPGRTSGE